MKRLLITLVGLASFPALATDVIDVKQLDADLANDISREAMYVCRGMGYQVSAGGGPGGTRR